MFSQLNISKKQFKAFSAGAELIGKRGLLKVPGE
jgi:hypothetical protein